MAQLPAPGRYCRHGRETQTAKAEKLERLKDRQQSRLAGSSKAVWLGEVEAPDEAAAMEKAAREFKVPANRLMA
jgi:hypothetical protein